MSEKAFLKLSGITKQFPDIKANDGVNLSISPGEIHALLGENGAGKSTLVKMIYGIMQPDEGEMYVNGEIYVPDRPFDARAKGIGMVFQHFSLFDALSVAENIALGIDKNASQRDLNTKIVNVSNDYGLPLDPTRIVGTLSVGERQRVEIVRCLLQNPQLLIMDEPTSVLTPQEIKILFETLRKLADGGCSILYISHKLEEIRSLCSTATVLRDGKVVKTCDPRLETARSLAEMMIGSSLALPQDHGLIAGDERLVVDNLTVRSEDPFGVDLQGISFNVHGGEILGIAGVAGNGQIQLMKALIGEHPAESPTTITLDGEPMGLAKPTERRKHGMCFVPEERLGHGAIADMTLWENTILSARTRKGMVKRGFLNNSTAAGFAKEIVSAFNVKAGSVNHAARSLSGGNVQKFIVGREILQSPSVLIVSQPTWGVDAGAAADIHMALQNLAKEGTAVLVISQDLDELMAISTRFAVISGGRLSQPKPTGDMTVEEIGLLMGGVPSSAEITSEHGEQCD